MDAWPTFWDWNKPLFEQHVAAGFRFVRNKDTAHFVDANGDYASHPVGYITGIGYSKNGSPNPYYASVYLGDSWAQYSGKTAAEVEKKAREKASKVVDEWLKELIKG